MMLERIDLIEKFLKTKGWHRIADPIEYRIVYQAPCLDDFKQPIHLFLPASSDVVDGERAIGMALNLLAVIEDRPVEEIREQIANLGSDFLKQRIISQTNADSLSLREIRSVISHLTNLIKYAAYQESEKKGVGQAMIEKCRFGQTFVGSFGISMEMPISSESSETAPLERRIMERIARGFKGLHQAVTETNPKILTKFDPGFYETAQKLLDAIPDSEAEFSFSWSPEYPQPTDLSHGSIRLSASYTRPLVERARQTLRASTEPAEAIVQGRITELHAEEPDLRFIIVEGELNKGNYSQIRIPLTPDQYRQACDAHRDEKPISIRGKPKKRRRSFFLNSPHDFKVLTAY